MRTDGNLGETLTFNPNSAGLWDNQPDFAEPPMPIEGDAAHWDHRVDDDHWEQPGNLFRKMTPAQQLLLFENTARAMGDARLHIKQRHVANCLRADPAYGGRGREGPRAQTAGVGRLSQPLSVLAELVAFAAHP
jgi:catalase